MTVKRTDFLKEINIDNKDGWGSTGNNRNVDYLGVKVLMKPGVFLKLALPLYDEEHSKTNIAGMIKHHNEGGSFASPTLYLDLPSKWYKNDVSKGIARVSGHEGRHRMNVQLKVEGDVPVETHLFVSGYRAKNWSKNNTSDYSPKIMEKIRMKMRSESGLIITGPLFELYDSSLSESDLAQTSDSGEGDCFVVSARAMLNNDLPGLKLVHAYVLGQKHLKGKRFPHAWNEIGDVVFDNSNGRKIIMRKEQYYDLGKVVQKPKQYAIYDRHEAIKKMAQTKHYGPWDLE